MSINNSAVATNKFIMDETLESVPKGNEIPVTNILKPYKVGDMIELKDNVSIAAPVSENEIVVLESEAIDLYDLEKNIKENGMCQDIALEMQRYCPDIVNDNRPVNYFTKTLSATGVSIALESIDDQKKSLLSKLKDAYDKIIKWIIDKFKEYKNKFTAFNKGVMDRVKAFRKQPVTGPDQQLIDLKKRAAELCKTPEELNKLKNFDIQTWFTQVLKNEFFKPLDNEDGLKKIVLISEGVVLREKFKKLSKLIESFDTKIEADTNDIDYLLYRSELMENELLDIEKSFEGITSIKEYGVVSDNDYFSVFVKMSGVAFGGMYLGEVIPIDNIISKIDGMKALTITDANDVSTINKISITLMRVLNLAKLISVARAYVVKFSFEYWAYGNAPAIQNAYKAAMAAS